MATGRPPRTKPARVHAGKDERPASTDVKLHDVLLSRASAEDVAAYEPEALRAATDLAWNAVKRHQRGDSVVAIDSQPDLQRNGLPFTSVTVVNDNMPFLFDSVLGELTESTGEPLLVAHPVLAVRHDGSGVAAILADAGSAREHGSDKLSVIHVHVKALGAEAAADLERRLLVLLAQVRAATRDWKPMLARLDHAISDFRYAPIPLDRDELTEAIAFLEWLRDDNFTFLGMREFRYVGDARTGELERTEREGLGILADPNVRVLRRDSSNFATTTPEVRAFLHGPEPLLVTKANAKSVVHRRAYLDYIGVKTFTEDGGLSGELRIVGLFTSTAYTRSVLKIPYLRSKVNAVIRKSGFDPGDHSGKALTNVLESYPRDELFQVSVPVLRKHAEAILGLTERPRIRALVRVDQFDRFVSVLVFVPRDRYDSQARERIGDYLRTVFNGRLSAYYPAFPEGGLARVHFIIGRNGGRTPKVESSAIESAIRDIVRTWQDGLRESAVGRSIDERLLALANRFPATYRGSFTASEALKDAAYIATLSPANPIVVNYYRDASRQAGQAGLKIFHYGEPVALSRRVPMLENMGFRVISERTFEVPGADGGAVFIHDMELESGFGKPIDLTDGGALFEEVLLCVWRGEADNDGYNALSQTAGLASRDISVLRGYGRYLQQAGIPQSQDFIAAVLNRYPDIARGLVQLFAALFDPGVADGAVTARHLKAKLKDSLQDVPNIDDDTIVRRYVNLIEATLRTNHYVADKAERGQSMAFKLNSREVEGLPEPRPWREIFVYGTEVEGVHLRFGPVARGGLRWSDRAQDYRTEVLGLVKAQQVKNAVIVPVGAKGGFYPKQLPAGGSREAVFEAGRKAYINFISSLLSVTDNLDGDIVVPPPQVVRRDTDDPYFVVAADKGTATFSDTANAISQAHGFWLDDAFASGGSAGYDHKKMGITARGAWEAVKRHFREMNRDIQAEPFTVVGVGDMSGDVFGNGMLLSEQTRLIAAFDHRDIFIDPNPDAAASFAERRRLFDLPRSSWQDYEKAALSEGGAIVSRAQKSVALSQAAADAIGLGKTVATPTEIMNGDPQGAGRPAVVRRHRHLCAGHERDRTRTRATAPTTPSA
jgi:glutamate dehydrogenase